MEDTITCPKCNTKVSVKELRADKTGLQWICVDCYSKQHSKEPKKESIVTERLREKYIQEKSTKQFVREPVYSNEPQIKKLASYKCTACNYKFESTTYKLNKMCPFCSRKDTVEKVKTASEILKEIDDIPDFS